MYLGYHTVYACDMGSYAGACIGFGISHIDPDTLAVPFDKTKPDQLEAYEHWKAVYDHIQWRKQFGDPLRGFEIQVTDDNEIRPHPLRLPSKPVVEPIVPNPLTPILDTVNVNPGTSNHSTISIPNPLTSIVESVPVELPIIVEPVLEPVFVDFIVESKLEPVLVDIVVEPIVVESVMESLVTPIVVVETAEPLKSISVPVECTPELVSESKAPFVDFILECEGEPVYSVDILVKPMVQFISESKAAFVDYIFELKPEPVFVEFLFEPVPVFEPIMESIVDAAVYAPMVPVKSVAIEVPIFEPVSVVVNVNPTISNIQTEEFITKVNDTTLNTPNPLVPPVVDTVVNTNIPSKEVTTKINESTAPVEVISTVQNFYKSFAEIKQGKYYLQNMQDDIKKLVDKLETIPCDGDVNDKYQSKKYKAISKYLQETLPQKAFAKEYSNYAYKLENLVRLTKHPTLIQAFAIFETMSIEKHGEAYMKKDLYKTYSEILYKDGRRMGYSMKK
jgi:hypothetical protein